MFRTLTAGAATSSPPLCQSITVPGQRTAREHASPEAGVSVLSRLSADFSGKMAYRVFLFRCSSQAEAIPGMPEPPQPQRRAAVRAHQRVTAQGGLHSFPIAPPARRAQTGDDLLHRSLEARCYGSCDQPQSTPVKSAGDASGVSTSLYLACLGGSTARFLASSGSASADSELSGHLAAVRVTNYRIRRRESGS